MNIIKKLICIMCIVVILFTFSACKKDNLNPVGKSPVPMHSVTQNSKDDYITFKFDIPKNWIEADSTYTGVSFVDSKYAQIQINPNSLEDYFKEHSLVLYVSNYKSSKLSFSKEEQKKYSDLLNGNPNTYKQYINEVLQKGGETLDNFQCDYYDGKKGKIAKIQFTSSTDEFTYTTVQCFRSDIPQYLVTGDIDESLDLSSGEIALWVMDSLEVKEHFKVKDNTIVKEKS